MTSVLSALLGVSFAAGLNAYATILTLGLLSRWGWIHPPAGLQVLATTPVLAAAAFLYLVEFVAGKVPWIDSLWDAIHTVIRPVAGAVLAYAVVGNVDPQWQ